MAQVSPNNLSLALASRNARVDDTRVKPQLSSIARAYRTAAVMLVLFGCAAALITHVGVLLSSGLDPASSPIGALAWTNDAEWFRYGLWLLAIAHLGTVLLLNQPGAGRFTRGAQFFLLLDAALIFRLPWQFAAISPSELTLAAAGGPLWLLGGSVGFAMTCVAGALWRSHRSTAFLTLVCLLLWSLLAPVFLAIAPDWIGAYQRSVGALLLFWMASLAVGIAYLWRIEN